MRVLDERLELTSPTFRIREGILNMRRTAFGQRGAGGEEQIGPLWLETSKIARKAHHFQTSYSALLQGVRLHAPLAYYQSAKLKAATDQSQRAIQELDGALRSVLNLPRDERPAPNKALAKAALRRAQYMAAANVFGINELVIAYQTALRLDDRCVGASVPR